MLRRRILSIAVLALVASGSSFLVVAPASATAPSGFTPIVALDGVSAPGTPVMDCPTTGSCSAAFQTSTNTNWGTTPPSSPTTGTKFYTQSSGTWTGGSSITPPAGYDFVTPGYLHCASAGNCVLVGTAGKAASYAPAAAYAVQTGGTWAGAQALSLPAGVTSFSPQAMSCGTSTTCSVVGYAKLTSNAQVPAAIDLDAGTWSAVQVIGGLGAIVPSGVAASLTSVSCTSASDCTAVGSANNSFSPSFHQLFTTTHSGSNWGDLSGLTNPGGVTGMQNIGAAGVACVDPDTCTIVGSFADSSWHSHLAMATSTAGTWSAVLAPTLDGLPVQSAELRYLTCAVGGPCVALGYWSGSDFVGHAIVVAAADGVNWAPVNLTDPIVADGQVDLASCNASGCLVAGHQVGTGMAKALAFGVNFSGDTATADASWDLDRAAEVSTSEALPACSSDGTCSLFIQNQSGSGWPMTSSFAFTTYHPKAGTPSAKVTLALSPEPGDYGHATIVTVNVKPTTIAGPVSVVNQDGRPVGHCYVSSGSCSFATTALRVGSTDLTATFRGPRPYGKVTATITANVNAATMLVDTSGSDTSRDRWPTTGVRKARVQGKLSSDAKSCVRARNVDVRITGSSGVEFGKLLRSSVSGHFKVRSTPLQPGSYTVSIHVDPSSSCEAADQSYDLTVS